MPPKPNELVASSRPNPKIELISVIPEFPLTGGIILRIKGKKSPEFVAKQARLRIGGDDFWRTLGQVIGPKLVATFKLTAHPITISPEMMNLNVDIVKGSEDVNTAIVIGGTGKYRAKKKSIVKRLQMIAQQGDPLIQFDFECGEKRVTWKIEGVLFTVTFTASQLLKAEEESRNLLEAEGSKTRLMASSSSEKRKSIKLSNNDVTQSVESITRVFPMLDYEIFNDQGQTMRAKAEQEGIEIIKRPRTDTAMLLNEIEKIQVRHSVRMPVKNKKHEDEAERQKKEYMREQSAVEIQRVWRGYRARKEFKEEKAKKTKQIEVSTDEYPDPSNSLFMSKKKKPLWQRLFPCLGSS